MIETRPKIPALIAAAIKNLWLRRTTPTVARMSGKRSNPSGMKQSDQSWATWPSSNAQTATSATKSRLWSDNASVSSKGSVSHPRHRGIDREASLRSANTSSLAAGSTPLTILP